MKEDREMHGTNNDFAKGSFMYLLLLRECHYNIQKSTANEKVIESLSSLTSPSASLSNKHIHRLDTIQQKSPLHSPGPFFKHMITTVDLSLAFSFFVMLMRALQPILSYSH